MLQLLEDPAYRHVLLNHIPVTGLAVAWVVLVVATFLRHRPTLFAALGLVAVTAGAALPAISAGNDAYPIVVETLDGYGRSWLDYHTHLADTWGPVFYSNAALALLAIGLGAWRAELLRRGAVVIAVLTPASLAVGLLIAEAGGQIRHPEFRLQDEPPKYEREGRL